MPELGDRPPPAGENTAASAIGGEEVDVGLRQSLRG